MKPRRRRTPSRWPFWLLLAAWACANTPALAVCATLAWLREARHFAHEQRLVTDVAFLLTGHEAPGRGLIAAAKDVAVPASLPSVPAEIELKKLDLALERPAEFMPPIVCAKLRGARAVALPDRWRMPPPHEPPRAGIAGC